MAQILREKIYIYIFQCMTSILCSTYMHLSVEVLYQTDISGAVNKII